MNPSEYQRAASAIAVKHELWKKIVNPTKNPLLHKLLVAHGVPIKALPLAVVDDGETVKRYPPGQGWQKHMGPNDVTPQWMATFSSGGVGALAVTGIRSYGAGVNGGLDVIDVDVQSGGLDSWRKLIDLGALPPVLAWQSTPSGGWHAFVKPLGLAKASGGAAVLPGLDYLGGRADGEGRAFVFLAPTIGASKRPSNKGELVPYRAVDLSAEHVPEDYWLDAGAEGAERFYRLVKSGKPAKAPKALASAEQRQPVASPQVKQRQTPTEPKAKAFDPRWSGYVAAAVAAEQQRLRELHGAPWGAGHGHDSTAHAAACALLDLADSTWNPWTREAAEVAWRAALDPAYDDRWVESKWESGIATVRRSGAEGRPEPVYTGATELEPLDLQALLGGNVDDLDFSVPGEAGKSRPQRSLIVKRASEIEPEPVTWLWEGRLPEKALSLLVGGEGLGKSSLSVSLAAQVTRGRLDGARHGTPSSVVIVATEDSWAAVVVPRLMAAGADLERVLHVSVRIPEGGEDELVLPVDVELLQELIVAESVALVILDPLLSRLDASLDSHKDAEVRRALEPVSKMADETGCSVLGLIHPNKSNSSSPLTQVMASRAFTAIPRAVLSVFEQPDAEDQRARVVGLAKCNLGPTHIPLLGFMVETVEIETRTGVARTAAVTWTGEVGGTIAEAAEASAPSGRKLGRPNDQRLEAIEWLRELLDEHDGPVRVAGIMKLASEGTNGFSRATVRRAGKDLGVVSERLRDGSGGSTWSLPQPYVVGQADWASTLDDGAQN